MKITMKIHSGKTIGNWKLQSCLSPFRLLSFVIVITDGCVIVGIDQ